jgi:excisionase family DNA binding protein
MPTWLTDRRELIAEDDDPDVSSTFHGALVTVLARNAVAHLELNGQRYPVGAGLLQLLEKAMTSLQEGRAVAYVTTDELLSPEEAARLLGVSRPFVYKLLDSGEIPAAANRGTHRKITVQAALEWRDWQAQRAQQAEALAARVRDTLPDELMVPGGSGSAPSRAALRRVVRQARQTGELDELRRLDEDRQAALVRESFARQADAVAAQIDQSAIVGARRGTRGAVESPPTPSAAGSRIHLHVVPRPGGWQVIEEQSSVPETGVFSTQGEAVRQARPVARREGGELVIHRRDGSVREKVSYRAGRSSTTESSS